jgi:hypothetical protein
MSEIYWITRFDPIKTCATIFLIVSTIVCIISIIVYIGSRIDNDKNGTVIGRKLLYIFTPVFIISLLLKVFVPTTKEAMLIYGVGGTIDYLKSNPVAKQIPDKCIIALDKWVDDLANEKSDTINGKNKN